MEILSEGDFVNELLILVGGMVEVLRPGADHSEELSLSLDGHSSMRGTCIRHDPPTLPDSHPAPIPCCAAVF